MGIKTKTSSIDGKIIKMQERIEVNNRFIRSGQYLDLTVSTDLFQDNEKVLQIPKGKLGDRYLNEIMDAYDENKPIYFSGEIKTHSLQKFPSLLWLKRRVIAKDYIGKIKVEGGNRYDVKYREKIDIMDESITYPMSFVIERASTVVALMK